MTWSRKIAVLGVCVFVAGLATLLWFRHKENEDHSKLAAAFRSCRVRAEAGDPQAQRDLGNMYIRGQGVAQNDNRAVSWYRKAADQGDLKAQYNLGICYIEGQGVPRDLSVALTWFRRAADQGDAQAQFKVGNMYYQGEGTQRDYAEALRWLRSAAAQGQAEAEYTLGHSYSHGNGVPRAYAEAARWFRRSAEHDYPVAQYVLGQMSSRGVGAPRDYAEAARWFRRAASHGYSPAQTALSAFNRRSGAWTNLRYLTAILGFLGGLFLFLEFLLPGRSIRSPRQKAITALGVLGMLFAATRTYRLAGAGVGLNLLADAYSWSEGLITAGCFVLLAYLVMSGKPKRT